MSRSRFTWAPALVLLMAVALPGRDEVRAHEGPHREKGSRETGAIEINEKIGGKIAGDAVFSDEKGMKLKLGSIIKKPTIILPVYYTCKSSCSIMLGNLARAVNDVPLMPGKEYGVIALSFDSDDSPATARTARENHLSVLKSPPPPGSWHFLSGRDEEIAKFTGSIGFSFIKSGKGLFMHPNTLVAVSPDGTIIRYLGGPAFLPFDIAMALTEAERGTPSISIRKLLSYCFSYENEKKTYTLRGVKIFSGIIIVIMGIFLFFILRKKNTADR